MSGYLFFIWSSGIILWPWTSEHQLAVRGQPISLCIIGKHYVRRRHLLSNAGKHPDTQKQAHTLKNMKLTKLLCFVLLLSISGEFIDYLKFKLHTVKNVTSVFYSIQHIKKNARIWWLYQCEEKMNTIHYMSLCLTKRQWFYEMVLGFMAMYCPKIVMWNILKLMNPPPFLLKGVEINVHWCLICRRA